MLELRNVYGNGDEDMSLELHAGEVLGLGGLVGAGRTELAQMIFGARRKTSGKIFFDGREIDPRSPREAIDIGIALVPEDRKRHGALLNSSIRDNINMPIYERISKASVIDSKTERATAEKYRESIQIKCAGIQQRVKDLSGGNQQKVILGKWLAASSRLIIFDEPTRGIDVGAKYEIYKLINDIVEAGGSVLMISSEMEELIGMSDRIIVLSENRMTGELRREDFDSDRIMAYASGFTDGKTEGKEPA
ncbi:MAG: sugar ABC transporter ATP-binding protein [Synergistaceae bacterium]|nr:sugar ABC transporter ATP-binding protein [Synergistaceae bacterium]